MSGPKYSRAVINEIARLERLAKQLEERIENEKRNQVLRDIEKLEKEKSLLCSDGIIDACKDMISQAEVCVADSDTLTQVKKLLDGIQTEIRNRCDASGNSAELMKQYGKYKESVQALKNKLSLIKTYNKQLEFEIGVAKQEKKEGEFLSIEWEDTGKTISVIPDTLKDLYSEVIELLMDSEDFEEKKRAIDEEVMSADTDLNYKTTLLKNRKNAILVEKNSSSNNIEVLSKINELTSLYSLLGGEAKEIPQDVEGIDAALKEAREQLKCRNEAEYVAACVHKVFKERGYSLLDDVVLQNNGKETEQTVYEYGDDSLVSVSMSDTGQMLFEVVGNGTQQGMDEVRSVRLESEMRRFCPDYKEIREILLRDYGISLEQEHLCEPERKYAKAIDVDKNSSDRRAKKEKKMMHYDD